MNKILKTNILLITSLFVISSWASNSSVASKSLSGIKECLACELGVKSVAEIASYSGSIDKFLASKACPKLNKYVHISDATCKAAMDDIAALANHARNMSASTICTNDLNLCS